MERLPLMLEWQDAGFASSNSDFSTSQSKIKMSGSYLHAQPPASPSLSQQFIKTEMWVNARKPCLMYLFQD